MLFATLIQTDQPAKRFYPVILSAPFLQGTTRWGNNLVISEVDAVVSIIQRGVIDLSKNNNLICVRKKGRQMGVITFKALSSKFIS